MVNLSSGGEIAVGLTLAVVAGLFNGSWNAAFIPRFRLAVGRTTDEDDGEEESKPMIMDLAVPHAWILFQVYTSVINTPICLYWAGGPERVSYILSNGSPSSMAAVVVFSILWGVGSAGFGVACRVAGVGLGTNLMMGTIMILGTLLPMLLEQTMATASGGMILGGIAVCCCGLYCSIKSLQTRDLDELQAATTKLEDLSVDDNMGEAISGVQEDVVDEDQNAASKNLVTGTSEEALPEEAKGDQAEINDEQQYSTIQKVAVCLVAAVFGGLLQFAFVLGEEFVDLAGDDSQGPGHTPGSGTAAVIWLLAIPLGAPASILYGMYTCPKHIPLSSIWKCPWYRHVLIVLTTSLPWLTHIHLYGLANTLLPDELSASIAWPILMMTTVTTGIFWSLVLGEWKQASALARRQLRMGLVLVALGVGLIMASVALSSST